MAVFPPRSILLGLLLVASCAPESAPNQVVEFLAGAERQIESDDQHRVLETALTEMLTLSAETLKARRYPDYRMTPNAWTALDVLTHYFVPATAEASLDSATFYQDVADPTARRAIQDELDEVRRVLAGE